MTNREKFKEVFGWELESRDIGSSQIWSLRALVIKSKKGRYVDCAEEWLNDEYKSKDKTELQKIYEEVYMPIGNENLRRRRESHD